MQPHRHFLRRLGGSLALASLLLATAAAGPALAQTQPQGQQPAPRSQSQQPAETQTFQDWTLACFDRQDGSQACRMLQNVANDQGQVVMQAAVIRLPDGNSGLLFNLPLGVWLPEGVTIQVDGGEQISVPYARCLPAPDQCRVELVLDDQRLAQLKAGTRITVTFYGPRQEPVRATVSLLGFTAAFDRLS